MSFRLLARVFPALLLTTTVACFDDKDDDDEDDDDDDTAVDWGTTGTWTGTGTGTGGGGGGPSASVTWGSRSVDLTVSGGPGAYWFGITESTCDDCWTGEDCIYGYSLGDGTVLAWCHDAGDTGTSLTYGGSPIELDAGTTVFPDATYDGKVTYYLESDPEFGGDGSCYVWGADPSYYAGLGCTNL